MPFLNFAVCTFGIIGSLGVLDVEIATSFGTKARILAVAPGTCL